MNRAILAILVLAALTAPAAAQPTATVRTTADGAAATTIAPGGTVRIAVSVSHNQFWVAQMAGGSIVTGDAGTPSNFSSTIPTTPISHLGEFHGGSRVDSDFATPPPGFPSPPTPWGINPMPVWQYDLTLPDPGIYDIVWVASAAVPNVRLYATFASFSYVEAQTTFIGATITVTPATPTLAALLAACALATPRRRANPHGATHA